MTLALNDSTLLKTQAFINGEWVDADSGKTFAVINPATGECLAQVANVGEAETIRAIECAQQAMEQWQKLSPEQRSAYLERWHALIVQNQADLAVIMTAEQGKSLAESIGELGMGASFIKWYAEEGKRVYGDVLPQPQIDRRGITIRQPVGVVAAITPWNFPHGMIARKAAPALAVGCAMVLKPSDETPLSALAMVELARRAGLPAGLFNVLPTQQTKAVGAQLTSHPTIKKLTFTGSTAVGKLLMAQCAGTVKRTSMELGGNAPVIVFDDADLDLAVAHAVACKFRNSGQTCICANRIFVHDAIYDTFTEKFQQAVAGFTLGNGLDDGTTHGPLINTAAVVKVQSLVEQAVADGASLLMGGQASDKGECFYEPTILTDVKPSMDIFSKEIFGPVAPLYRFSTEDEVIALANDTEYGLAAYIFTENLGRSWRVSEGLQYGMVGVNETAISSNYMPFGGIKESGQGREGSKHGLDDYLETKYICMGALHR